MKIYIIIGCILSMLTYWRLGFILDFIQIERNNKSGLVALIFGFVPVLNLLSLIIIFGSFSKRVMNKVKTKHLEKNRFIFELNKNCDTTKESFFDLINEIEEKFDCYIEPHGESALLIEAPLETAVKIANYLSQKIEELNVDEEYESKWRKIK